MRLQVDLSDSLNWTRLGTWNLVAQRRESGNFTPIPPVSAVAPSPLVLVAGFNDEAPSRWTLGAWCHPAVSVDPGSTAGGINLGVLPRQAVSLNRYSLIVVPQFAGVTNYLYSFYPARWLPELLLEAWWYDGPVTTDVQQDLAAIKAQLGI